MRKVQSRKPTHTPRNQPSPGATIDPSVCVHTPAPVEPSTLVPALRGEPHPLRGDRVKLLHWLRSFAAWVRPALLDAEEAMLDPSAPTSPEKIEALFLGLRGCESPYSVRDDGALAWAMQHVLDTHHDLARATYAPGEAVTECSACDNCGNPAPKGKTACAFARTIATYAPPVLPEQRPAVDTHAIDVLNAKRASAYCGYTIPPTSDGIALHVDVVKHTRAALRRMTELLAAVDDPLAPGAAALLAGACEGWGDDASEGLGGLLDELRWIGEGVEASRTPGEYDRLRERAQAAAGRPRGEA